MTIKILAISGSLRKASSNKAFLCAAASLVPEGVDIYLYGDLGNLPLFNPDLEGFEPPSVLDFRAQLRAANAILIASPEYAHGITGVMKNALDWIVASGEFVNKPVALVNTSSRAKLAYESLKEILKTMDAFIVPEASQVIPLPNDKIDLEGILKNKELCHLIQETIEAFVSVVKSRIQIK